MASAPSFTTDRIRNVVVVGHGGAGKTTLIDACCHASGATRRHGSTDDGTALTMFTPEEVAHGISMNTCVAYATWADAKVNFVDTPGYLDFLGETRAGVRVADGAICVVSGPGGVEVGTERVWDLLEERHLPTILFVSMMDRANADFERVYQDVKEHLTAKVIPVEVPIGSGEGFRGIVNLLHASDKAHFYRAGTQTSEYDEGDIPPDVQPLVDRFYAEMIETIAATDDTLLEHYLEGDTISRGEAVHALKQAMLRGELYPLFCGAPTLTWGVENLLDNVVELMPSPQERPAEEAFGRTGNTVELRNLNSDPFCALVFKTTSEPHVGELSFLRVFGGSVKSGDEVLNAERDKAEKLAHLSIAQGKERFEVDELRAGDIGVVAKLRDTHTNDTLSAPGHPLRMHGVDFPEPDIAVAVEALNRGEEDKLSTGLHKLHEEDPCFAAEFVAELGQTIARGLGELHLEVQLERLKRKAGVSVSMRAPRIPYRETIRAVSEAHGRYKKQTGGRGQFGDAHVRLKPRPRGDGYVFTDSIVGGVIPGKYVPAVDRGIQEASARGILAGFPVVDFEAEVYFGSYHSVDSSEAAFKVAGSMAFQQAAERAQPVILEPIMLVEVFTPEEFLGDVIGDLNQRRGQILGIEPAARAQKVRSLVPQAELYKYSTSLRSLSQGRATHTRTFHSYEEVPAHEVPKLVEATRKEREELAAAR
ncbi:MAG: small GTP-binding protein [Gemmatimonadetes bacterium]|nr:small GTP-binding protein [Gemmatimonadota bacterium]